MILECPNCDTQYEIPVELPPQGRKVRCAACQHIWVAMPADTAAEQPATLPRDAESAEPPQDAAAEAPAQYGSEDVSEEFASQETGAAAPAPDLDALEAFTDEEIVFKNEQPDEPGAEEPAEEPDPQAAAEPAAEEMFTDSEMEDAFSAAVAEAGMASPDAETETETEPEQEPDSPPIVIGKAKRKHRGALPGKLAAGWAALAVALAGVVSAGYYQRVNIVRLFPGAAPAYERLGLAVNVRGLEFRGVKYSWETSAGRPVLEVYGDIENITARPLKVPTVVFGLRTKERVEVYQWAADVRSDPLPPGERTAFAAQIPSPPKSIRDVQVRFAKVK